MDVETVQDNILTDIEHEYCQQMIPVFKVIEQTMVKLQIESLPSGMLKVKYINQLNDKLVSIANNAISTYDAGKAIALAFMEQLHTRWATRHMVPSCTLAFLSKPFNGEFCPSWWTGEEKEFMRGKVIQWLHDMEPRLREAAERLGYVTPLATTTAT